MSYLLKVHRGRERESTRELIIRREDESERAREHSSSGERMRERIRREGDAGYSWS